MRLSKIRIAGFKSFVDPVTLDLRSNLVGILGPNGCGKSNTIDAVRWVMGESSAKHLRGQSMDDVIFNGSSARKPVGLASVELVFDNSSGDLGGEYAQYAEISVKRQVSREGISKYFLNGSRCRRRDITDIFLGTGLGPRSYAIIEQGMISRLIEAKPEELRNTLEEAAGISRYKDRRRETENRIKHTRENLERLTDLRDELEKQLQKLDRQAKAAVKFRALRSEAQQLEALLLLLQERDLQRQSHELNQKLSKQSITYQAQLSVVRHLESGIEQLRLEHSAANDTLNEVQGEFYQAGAEISRIEQALRHQQMTRERQQQNLQQIRQSLAETHQHAEEDRLTLEQSQQQLDELEPQAETLEQALEDVEEHLFDVEEQLQGWQEHWQRLQQNIAEPTRQAQIEKTRLEQIEQQLRREQQRLQRLEQEASNLPSGQLADDTQVLEQRLAAMRVDYQQAEDTLETLTIRLQQAQQQLQEQQAQLSHQRTRQQALQGRLASLHTLQQASLNKDNKDRQRWLAQHDLAELPQLAEQLEVAAGWEIALETVLGHDLMAVCVAALDRLELPANTQGWAGVSLLETGVGQVMTDQRGARTQGNMDQAEVISLNSKVKHPVVLHEWLTGIYCIDSLSEALQRRTQLSAATSFITPQGIWVGRHWIRTPQSVQGKDKQGQGSRLQRQQEIRQLHNEKQALAISISELEAAVNTARETLRSLDQQRQQSQAAVNQLYRTESETASQLKSLQQRIAQQTQRQEQMAADRAEAVIRLEELREEQALAILQQDNALAALAALTLEQEQLTQAKEPLQHAQQDARAQMRDQRSDYHDVQLAMETQRSQLKHSQLQLERVAGRLSLLEQQQSDLLAQMAEQDDQRELQAELETALAQRVLIERRLSEARQQVQTLDHEIRRQDGQRIEAERAGEALRSQQEQLKLDWQAVQVRLQTITAQFDETEFVRDRLLADYDSQGQAASQAADVVATNLAKHDETAAIRTRLDDLQRSIQRLGAINLAAIAEFQEQSERKAWLDQQNDDLVTALETLETAMRRIDRETRSRFKATFDHVNKRLQAMFPRLFGGGACYLAMTSDDLLTTGIAIMARPPGKRISSIHLLSGGEKALTAVALVFAIFELNPAPFCLLDEVDAPLDEANVGRFCDLVSDMAERVQFIFITHNKRTMELAENLIGVTMREPGVSRLVAVDVAEAVQLANKQE